jgi:hypothetical protein
MGGPRWRHGATLRRDIALRRNDTHPAGGRRLFHRECSSSLCVRLRCRETACDATSISLNPLAAALVGVGVGPVAISAVQHATAPGRATSTRLDLEPGGWLPQHLSQSNANQFHPGRRCLEPAPGSQRAGGSTAKLGSRHIGMVAQSRSHGYFVVGRRLRPKRCRLKRAVAHDHAGNGPGCPTRTA